MNHSHISWENKTTRLLSDSLLKTAHSSPEKIGFVIEGTNYTYKQLHSDALYLTIGLQSRGVKRGDRVAIYMDNTWPCIVSIYATLMAGGVFIVINPQTKTEKLSYLLNNSDTEILLTDAHLHSSFSTAIQKSPKIIHVIYSGHIKAEFECTAHLSQFDSVLSESTAPMAPLKTIPNDLAALVYTSGSTGPPKGVMLTHQAMVFATGSLIQYLRLTLSDRLMLVLPFSFDYGLYQLLMSVHLGATLIVERSFTFPAQIYKRMLEEEATVFPGVPTIFAMITATHNRKSLCFPSVTRVTNTAAALPPSLIPDLKNIFPNALIYKMYGQTECKRISYLEPEFIDQKSASVGKAIPGTEVFILSPNGDKVQNGESGILHVRGPHLMAGYWKNDKKSQKVLKPGLLPGEQILCTHDTFHMDKEGFLFFEGRSDDIIKTRGEKVSPLEVENALLAISGIIEVAVVGTQDDILGEKIVAYIVVENDFLFNEKHLKKKCLTILENFMVPQTITCLPTMPKTQNGKIDKKKLATMAENR
ncbi:MAG: long-chain acyl-CoA synthetase [Desulforhopalus sp.]|jgi:long-chain acyl-CoA synthetase